MSRHCWACAARERMTKSSHPNRQGPFKSPDQDEGHTETDPATGVWKVERKVKCMP